jgi:hypothetical protein
MEHGAGVGRFTDREGRVKVILDPGGFLLTSTRRTRKVDELPEACVSAPEPEIDAPAP